MKQLFITIFFFVCIGLFGQSTFYIDSQNGNDNDDGLSEGSAWKSISNLQKYSANSKWNQIVAGSKVLLKYGSDFAPSSISDVGVIDVPLGKNGTSTAYIEINAYGNPADGLPVVSTRNLPAGFWQAWRAGEMDYWIIKNIRFEGEFATYPSWTSDQVPTRATSFITIEDCEFDGRVKDPTRLTIFTGWSIYNHTQVPNPNTYAYLGWYPAATHDVTIKGNKFWSSSGEDCINMVCVGDNIYVGYNEFYGSNEEFLDIAGGANHVVEYNFAYATNSSTMKFHSQFSVLTNLTFRGNILVKGMSNGAAAAFENVVNSSIYNNTLVGYENGWAGWFGDMDRSGLYAYYGTFDNNIIKNNVFYGSVGWYGIWNNVTGTYGSPGSGRMFTDNDISNNSYYLIQNNDLYYTIRIRMNDGSGGETDQQIQPTQTATWATYWTNFTGTTEKLVQHSVEPYMGLTNPEAGSNGGPSGAKGIYVEPYNPDFDYSGKTQLTDFVPLSTSSLVNTGVAISGYTTDILGNPVNLGGMDRGAIEYQSGPTPSTFTWTPTSLNFGYVQKNTAGSTQMLTLNNIGTTGSLQISSITVSGDSSALYSIQETYYYASGVKTAVSLPFDMDAGRDEATIYIEVDFAGSATSGTKNTNLVIDSDWSSGQISVPVTASVLSDNLTLTVTGDTTYTFIPQYSTQLFPNSDFLNWDVTGAVPDDWYIYGSENISPPTVYLEKAGASSAHIYADNGIFLGLRQSNSIDDGGYVYFKVGIDSIPDGSLRLESNSLLTTWDTAGVFHYWADPDGNDPAFSRNSTGGALNNIYIDYIEAYNVTGGYLNTVTLRNASAGGDISGSVTIDDDTHFTVAVESYNISAGQTYDINVYFTPADTGYHSATVTATSNAGQVITIDVDGYFVSGTSPSAVAYIDAVPFTVSSGDTSVAITDSIGIYNAGTDTLTIDTLYASTNTDDAYTITSSVDDVIVVAGDTTWVTYTITPDSVKRYTFGLTMVHDASNRATPYTVTKYTDGLPVSTPAFYSSLSSSTIGWTLNVGDTEVKTIVFTNLGTTSMTYSLNSLSSPFSLVGNSGSPTAQYEEDTLRIQATGTVAGEFASSITITNSSTNQPTPTYNLLLVVNDATPEISVSPSSVAFSAEHVGNIDTSVVTITSDNGALLSGDISYSGHSAISIANGGSYSTYNTKQFNVIINRTDVLPYYGTVTITSNDADEPNTYIAVTGSGLAVGKLGVYPTSHSFGNRYVNSTISSPNFYSYNTGMDTLIFTRYMATGTNFTLPADTLTKTLLPQLLKNPTADYDTNWTHSNTSILNGVIGFSADSGVISQDISNLRRNYPYVIVAEFQNHANSGDQIRFKIGNATRNLTSGNYVDGLLVLEMYSGQSLTDSTFSVMLHGGGTLKTEIKHIYLCEYARTNVDFTPTTTGLLTDNLTHIHDSANQVSPKSNSVSGTGTGGGMYTPGKIIIKGTPVKIEGD
jgi:hypothetical protein